MFCSVDDTISTLSNCFQVCQFTVLYLWYFFWYFFLETFENLATQDIRCNIKAKSNKIIQSAREHVCTTLLSRLDTGCSPRQTNRLYLKNWLHVEDSGTIV